MRRIGVLINLLISFCLFQVLALSPQEALNKFISNSSVPENSVAVQIVDLSNNKVIASHNADLPLIPASIMKSVTTASLFEEAGPSWRYHTKAFTDGPNDMGTLRGNIVIVGSCDPSLHSTAEPHGTDFINEIITSLKDQKISVIEGEIIIDESEFAGPPCPSSWGSGDLKKYYGTGSHAFNYENNASGNNAVQNPGALFKNNLKKSLTDNGITLEGKHLGEGKRKLLHDHVSPPLDEIMRSCMMRSDNLFAECMLRTYGKLAGTDGSTKEAAEKEMARYKKKGFDMNGVNIIDGSGLSRQNRVTANFMSDLLSDMSEDAVYASFFPLAGQEGTMKKFLAGTSLDSYIAMKTGSMTGIQCYAGYKLDDNYEPTHVIVFIMNDLKARDNAKQAAQQMLLDIFGIQQN